MEVCGRSCFHEVQSFYQRYLKIISFLYTLSSANVHFPFPVLLTGGRFLGRFERSISFVSGCIENGRLRNASIKTEILGCNQTLEPHPEIWGHSLALTNDYRILFCGGIKTIKEEEMCTWPFSWGDVQGKYLVNLKH